MEAVCTICCAAKRQDEGLLPARQRYLSPRIAQVGAESRDTGRPFLILSGELGLIGADEKIPWYENLLTRESVSELVSRVIGQLGECEIERLRFFSRARDTPGWAPYVEVIERACAEAGVALTFCDYDLCERLLELAERDRQTRNRLATSGELFDGYQPEMERVHVENAAVLEKAIEKHGWPGESVVGRRASEAAWLVAQHAISLPSFQKKCLALLRGAVEAGEAPPAQAAYLFDRIRFNQRRPQRFGTILDWDREGRLSPWEIEDAGDVETRRRETGLSPLAETVAQARAEAAEIGESSTPSADYAQRQRRIAEWARAVGWLPDR